jgi:hypothetical protein
VKRSTADRRRQCAGPGPVAAALRETSALQPQVKPGLGALESRHKECIAQDLRRAFADSQDIDAGLRRGREREHRWDYLLGHRDSSQVIALEPHPVSDGEIKEIIRKKAAAQEQLSDHLKADARIVAWLWVASDSVPLAPTERGTLLLNQAGIRFVGTTVRIRDIPVPQEAVQRR